MDVEVAERLRTLQEWVAPSHGLKVETIDAHAAGQPLRLILSGLPPLRGSTLMERWRFARENFDHLRRALLLEPRGHVDMCGCLLTRAQRSDSRFGALFMHRGGFSPVCGHGIIALTTILLETGLVPIQGPETELNIDTMTGQVRCRGHVEGDRVRRVSFENVPSFAVAEDQAVEVPGLGLVKYDMACGGAFFAFVEAASLGLECVPENAAQIQRAGRAILEAINAWQTFHHPLGKDLEFLFGVVFVDSPRRNLSARADSRQVCVYSEGCLDRGPSGAAICARLALMAARGEVAKGSVYTVEGILGHTFTGRIVALMDDSQGRAAPIVEVEGSAWITGRHTFFLDAGDPCQDGFFL